MQQFGVVLYLFCQLSKIIQKANGVYQKFRKGINKVWFLYLRNVPEDDLRCAEGSLVEGPR